MSNNAEEQKRGVIELEILGGGQGRMMAGGVNVFDAVPVLSFCLRIGARGYAVAEFTAVARSGSRARFAPETVIAALRAEADRIEGLYPPDISRLSNSSPDSEPAPSDIKGARP